MRKKILEKRLRRLAEKKESLKARALESQDVKEVRAMQDQIADIDADIAEAQEELDAIAEEERAAAVNKDAAWAKDERSMPPAGAQLINGSIVGSFAAGANTTQARQNDDPFATMEYRRAFMKYAQTGEPISANLIQRDGAPANTTTLGATIPTTILNEFVDEVRKVYGQLYNKVRKLNIQGGVKVPISKLQATFKWITESTASPRQDGGTIDESVQFSYNIGELRVAQTLLSNIVTIDLFEREIVRIMVIAYLQAMDNGIINGTGEGQMLGILNDPRVLATGNVVEMSAADLSDWTQWRKKFFSKLPLGWRNGEFIFPVSTVESYLETMADANNNPIFRQATGLEVNDLDDHNPNGRFFGREVTLVEPDIIPDFDTAQSGDVIGVFWQPQEYAINTQMEFGMKRYFDEDRNEWVDKMLTVVDGKMLNVAGVWLIKKK